MARLRPNSSKWGSRPSRKRRPNRNKKPSKIRKNNSKLANQKKPSRQIRKNQIVENDRSFRLISCEEEFNEEIQDERIVHDFLSESPKENIPFCPHSRIQNNIQIPLVPECLKLGFLEQRAVALMHCYMSILIIRGRSSSMKGQVVHCQTDALDNIGDLLPFPKCYEFMAVIQQKPSEKHNEIRSTVRYSVSATQILNAILYLIQNHIAYTNKQVLPLRSIEEMFQCRKEDLAPIRIIDSYAYNNSTMSSPIILDSNEDFLGPCRTLKVGENPVWNIQPGMEECTFPWLYPTGQGGELDMKRHIPLKLRDYYKLRLMSVDKRWQSDSIWVFRAMNLIQRDDLCTAVNYHAKQQFKKDRLCYNIYPSIGRAIRGTAAFWSTPRKMLRAMYATLSKPNIFLSINLQDDVEFLTHIDPVRFGHVENPKYDAIDSLSNDDYLQLVNENSALVARMCHRRMLAFEKFVSDKNHPFFIDYIVTNYFFKIEFQRGGLPHLHTLLWLENFPSIDTAEGRQSIIDFIDKFLSTALPDKQTDPEGHVLVKKKQWHFHTFTCAPGNIKVRIRRGRKFKDQQEPKSTKANQLKDVNKNYLHENEIYQQVDPNKDPDLLQILKDKKEFFERLGCRFGSPCQLSMVTHFRSYKEARILTRGDRDIIIKRLTEESRRIIPYNMNLLKTFRCNHDIQVITDPWASAEYLFSYVAKNAHMEKDLVYQLSNCTCESLTEAKSVLLKTGNAILSHRQVGKVEASWTVLGIPLYHSSMRYKSLYISLPWEEERILKRGRIEVNTTDDFIESLTHKYVKRPSTPAVIDQMTLFEFLTWFDYDRSSSAKLQDALEEPLVQNPLWRTNFEQPALLKTSALLPRIVLSCGTVLIQHKEPTCISFICRYDNSMLAMYSMLCIGISYRNPIEEFLNSKLENDVKAIHQVLLKHRTELSEQFGRLPGAYQVQMLNSLELLCDLNNHDFFIQPKTSFIFTGDDDDSEDGMNQNTIDSSIANTELDKKDLNKNATRESINDQNDEDLDTYQDLKINFPCTRTQELLASANDQQRFLADFLKQYLAAVMQYEQRKLRVPNISKPLPFHIVVNGLAGSGKSYAISIIEQMLTDFCISESAIRNRPRRRKGLLKMAHTGKAALNIHGWTIHTALSMRPDNTTTPNNAPAFKLHSLRNRLGELILIIIDEISLVSYNLFQKVNKRLNEIFQVSDKSDTYFGNIPILLFGDLAQCEPVAAKQIFWRPSTETFSLWTDLFRPINFNINMRQGEDREFFEILCRMRLGQYTEQDEVAIKSRSIRKEDNLIYYKDRLEELNSSDFSDTIYAYSVRSKTNERNSMKLKETAMKLKKPIWIIQSIDKIGMARTSLFNPIHASKKEYRIQLKPSDDENECGSMFRQLPLCIGARVICRRNIDFDGQMVNGTEAIVKDIIWEDSQEIVLPISNTCVFPNLDRAITVTLPKYVELELEDGSIYKMLTEEVSFKDKNGIWMTRRQLPLSLGYAITVHRSQCMTYNKLVVDLTGKNWKPGMFYTILSRTRKLTDIIILAYDRKSFKVSKSALNEMIRLEKIEQEYPIKIEHYLRSERYVDWCLSRPFDQAETSSVVSSKTSTTTLIKIDSKRPKYEASTFSTSTSLKKPEDIIICEKQESLYCGRHMLRAVSQRLDLFSDTYLKEVAQNLANFEQIYSHQESVLVTEYYHENTGEYNIDVLKAALLNIFNVDLIQIRRFEENISPLQTLIASNITNIQALIIQQDYHYYCLRRFELTKDYFFKLDSKNPMNHERIHIDNLRNYLQELIDIGANVYVTILRNLDEEEDGNCANNIQTRLWPFPQSKADLEVLIVNQGNQ
ncbi:unnamed protein product [Adineta ricciae]|uniref:ATP-dependent DNA helicase n=1 Tax=Adineta ricciae TaxID=249248 RepID=A0A814W5I7_ADIRI|nr:unnamed protein product [Adineta ricciae]